MAKITFLGAAQEVTGSCFLVEDEQTKFLVDCGIFQCPRFCDLRTKEPFPFNPKELQAVFVTHAHVDHTGRVPRLVKDGFSGRIYSTHPAKDLSEVMLKDSQGVLAKEAARAGEGPLYEESDVDRALAFWEGKNYHENVNIGKFKITFYDAGHVLGSSMIMVEHLGKKILFTGDLGNPENPLLGGFEKISDVNILVMESTYGDTSHEDLAEKKLKLERVIERSIVRGGVLMIPAFSLERTQELLWEISSMLKNKQVPNAQIYLDSPLAIKATAVYQKHFSYLNKVNINKDSFSFLNFPFMHATLSTEESKKINDIPPPKIIIAGSGMSTGGRILHHERRYLSDPNSTILFVGYQAPGSLGRRIRDGAESVQIFGEEVPVRCYKEEIHGYSAHPDENVLFDFVRTKSNFLQKAYMVHGEPKTLLSFVQKVRDYLGIEAHAPKHGESVII